MMQVQLTNSVIEWERRLAYETERRANHRFEPYVNFLAAPRPNRIAGRPGRENRAPVDFVRALAAVLFFGAR